MIFRHLAVLALMMTIGTVSAVPCRANFLVTISDLSLAEKGIGFVDVMISSDAVLGDPLNFAIFQFEISTLGVTRLEFVDPQLDSQLGDSGYVFFGDGVNENFGLPVGSVGTNVVPNDTFMGGDNTLSGSDVVVTTDRLLARLYVTAATTLPPGIGETFTIHLVSGPLTSFESTGGLLAYTSIDGTVNIIAATVPEPSTFCLWAGAATVGMLTLWRRRG